MRPDADAEADPRTEPDRNTGANQDIKANAESEAATESEAGAESEAALGTESTGESVTVPRADRDDGDGRQPSAAHDQRPLAQGQSPPGNTNRYGYINGFGSGYGNRVGDGDGRDANAWDVALARRQAELAALRPPWSSTPAEAARAYLTDYLRPGGMPLLGPHYEPISAETARRLACDAKIIPVVLGSRSEPLDIGRASRTVPLPMRRAIELRDVHCRFPGCDRPAKWSGGTLAWVIH